MHLLGDLKFSFNDLGFINFSIFEQSLACNAGKYYFYQNGLLLIFL